MFEKSKMVGDVETSHSPNSVQHSVKLYLMEDELATYIPAIGDDAEWAPEESSVESWRKEYIGPGCYLLHITAVPTGELSVMTSEGLDSFVEKSYSTKEIFIPKEFFGIRIASSDDVENKILNIYNLICSIGDYLYRDSSATSSGNADFTLSPFKDPVGLDQATIEQYLSTKLYTCVYYTKRLINNLSDFVGVNGSFSTKCAPAERSTGAWKAVFQKLELHRDKEGQVWTKVTRSMLLAPQQCRWSSIKNGGTWKW